MIEINHVLHKQMRSLGKVTYKKFLCREVINNWNRLVDENIAAQVTPVAIERGVLFVQVENSAFKDQLKFFKEEIIDAINETFGQDEPLVKNIQIAKGFQIPDPPQEKIPPAPVEEPTIEDMTLTEEETARCQEQANKFPDKLRQTVLATLVSQIKVQKLRLKNGWHKCVNCNALCPPKEMFCEVCKVKERNLMINKLFDIFYDSPWLRSWDAQKILLEQMPHMRSECTLDVVDSARTSLIQNLASHHRFGDEDSPDIMKLVMLKKQLPPDKVTPAIIRRALYELQFNLAERFTQK